MVTKPLLRVESKASPISLCRKFVCTGDKSNAQLVFSIVVSDYGEMGGTIRRDSSLSLMQHFQIGCYDNYVPGPSIALVTTKSFVFEYAVVTTHLRMLSQKFEKIWVVLPSVTHETLEY